MKTLDITKQPAVSGTIGIALELLHRPDESDILKRFKIVRLETKPVEAFTKDWPSSTPPDVVEKFREEMQKCAKSFVGGFGSVAVVNFIETPHVAKEKLMLANTVPISGRVMAQIGQSAWDALGSPTRIVTEINKGNMVVGKWCPDPVLKRLGQSEDLD